MKETAVPSARLLYIHPISRVAPFSFLFLFLLLTATNMPFPYKNVLITGATSGIGLALAERMITAGIFVIAVGRRKERLDDLVAKHGSDKVAAEVFDVGDVDALPAWVER
jgi:NADPH:quinone reductase-like Zn-dependent oxidoreductase